MGYHATNCKNLDNMNHCRHPSHARSNWNPLRWLLGSRPLCVFATVDDTLCIEKEEVPRQPTPKSYTTGVSKPQCGSCGSCSCGSTKQPGV